MIGGEKRHQWMALLLLANLFAGWRGGALWADYAFDPRRDYVVSVRTALASLCAGGGTVLGYFRGTVQAAVDTDCAVGGGLRGIFGVQHVWLQFLPSVVGVLWFAFYWKRHRNAWVWEKHLPLLLLVSIGSASYFWVHDFVIAIPALIALAIQVDRARVWHIVTVTYLMVQVVTPELWTASGLHCESSLDCSVLDWDAALRSVGQSDGPRIERE